VSASAIAECVKEPSWQSVVTPYKKGNAAVALFHLAAGLAVLAIAWAGMALAYDMADGRFWGLALAVPAGAMLVRLFAIQHDCGHGALFNQPWANDLLGRLLCPLVMTPYTQWSREHAKHHATSGHLDFRGIGDVDTWTVQTFAGHAKGESFDVITRVNADTGEKEDLNSVLGTIVVSKPPGEKPKVTIAIRAKVTELDELRRLGVDSEDGFMASSFTVTCPGEAELPLRVSGSGVDDPFGKPVDVTFKVKIIYKGKVTDS
jgi:hypothetical protein